MAETTPKMTQYKERAGDFGKEEWSKEFPVKIYHKLNGKDGLLIRIDLGKFTDAFAAIKISSEQTAKVLTDSWQGNEALLQNIDESLVGLDETEKKAELARRAQAKKDAIANKEKSAESMFGAKVLEKNLRLGFKGLKDGFMAIRSEEHTSELRHRCNSYAVFCLKKKKI